MNFLRRQYLPFLGVATLFAILGGLAECKNRQSYSDAIKNAELGVPVAASSSGATASQGMTPALSVAGNIERPADEPSTEADAFLPVEFKRYGELKRYALRTAGDQQDWERQLFDPALFQKASSILSAEAEERFHWKTTSVRISMINFLRERLRIRGSDDTESSVLLTSLIEQGLQEYPTPQLVRRVRLGDLSEYAQLLQRYFPERMSELKLAHADQPRMKWIARSRRTL